MGVFPSSWKNSAVGCYPTSSDKLAQFHGFYESMRTQLSNIFGVRVCEIAIHKLKVVRYASPPCPSLTLRLSLSVV